MKLNDMPSYGIVFGVSGFTVIIVALSIFAKDPVIGLGLSALGYTLLVGSITIFSNDSLDKKIDKILNKLEEKRRK